MDLLFITNFNFGNLEAPFWYLGVEAPFWYLGGLIFAPWVTMLGVTSAFSLVDNL